MKKLFIVLALLLSVTVSYSQDTLQRAMAALYTVVVAPVPGGPGGAKGFIVNGFLNDPLGVYTVDSVDVGDIVWDASGNRFEILEINSRGGSTINVDVEALTEAPAVFDTGVGCIQTETGVLPLSFIIGLSDITKQSIANHTRVVDKYDEIQSLYMVGNKMYITGSLVPIDFDTVGSSCIRTLTQTAHGFSELEAIYYDGAEYVSMLGLYGDSQEPLFIVTDSIDANTFVVSAGCGIVDDDYGKPNGLYYWTDTGFNLNPDTVEYPVAKIYNGMTLFMNLPGFEFDATNKDLLDIVTVTGQRTLKGGQVIPMFLDSIAVIDTICGTPVENLAEYLLALEGCVTPVPDSLMRSELPSGIDTTDHVLYVGATGKAKGDAALHFSDTNKRLKITTTGVGNTFVGVKNFILSNTTPSTVGTFQNAPSIEFDYTGWKTNATAASIGVKGYVGFTSTSHGSSAAAEFNVQGTIASTGVIANLIRVGGGEGVATSKIHIGSHNIFSVAGGILVGNKSSVTAQDASGFGYSVNASGLRSFTAGHTTSVTHTDAFTYGSFNTSGAASTGLLGMGHRPYNIMTSVDGSVGVGHRSGLPNLLVYGYQDEVANSWTAATTTITLTTPVAGLVVGQGFCLSGTQTTNHSWRTITSVTSTTVFTVDIAPSVSSGTHIAQAATNSLTIGNGANQHQHLVVNKWGGVGLGVTAPTSRLHLAAGTDILAPFKFTTGVNLTTPQAGAVEWDGTNLHITQTTGPTRKTFAYTTDIVATNLSLTGTSPLYTLNSSTGTDVTITAGSGIAIIRTSNDLTVTTIEQWGEVAVSGGSTSVTTGTPERPDNDTPGTPTGNTSAEFTQSGSTITYTAAAGQSEITGTVSFTPTTGGDYLVSIFQEGTEIASTKVRVTVAAGTYAAISLPKVNVTTATNDTFDLRIEPVSGTDTITVYRYTIYSRKIY